MMIAARTKLKQLIAPWAGNGKWKGLGGNIMYWHGIDLLSTMEIK